MADYILNIDREIKCCSDCPCIFEYFSKIENKQIFHCSARNEDESRFADDFDINTKPTEGCPLVALPPHGELIDRDGFFEAEKGKSIIVKNGEDWQTIRDIFDSIRNAPTVVETTT